MIEETTGHNTRIHAGHPILVCLLRIQHYSEADESWQENDNIFGVSLCFGVCHHDQVENAVIYMGFSLFVYIKLYGVSEPKQRYCCLIDVGKFDFKRKPRPHLLNPSL